MMSTDDTTSGKSSRTSSVETGTDEDVGLFALVMPVFLLLTVSGIFILMRAALDRMQPLSPPNAGLWLMLCQASCVTVGISVIAGSNRMRSGFGEAWAVYSLIVLLGLPTAMRLLLPQAAWEPALTGFVAIACGVIVFLLFVRWRRSRSAATPPKNRGTALGAILTGILLGSALVASQVGGSYVQPISLEMAVIGKQHHDTLYHAAIASMVTNHGVSSVGLNGLAPVNYHILSHIAFGSQAEWLKVPMLLAYSQFTLLVIFPAMFVLFTIASFAHFRANPNPLSPVVRVILTLALLLLFSAIFGGSSFKSESYAFSLLFFLAAIAIQPAWHAQPAGRLRRETATLVLIAILVLACTASKASTGAVLACGMAFAITARHRFRPTGFVLAAVFGLLPSAAALFLSGPEAGESYIQIRPFAYLMDFPRHSIVSMIAGLAGVFFALRHVLTARQDIAVPGTLVILALAAIVSSQLLDIPAGAAGYFANPAIWAGTLAIAAYGPVHPRFAGLGRRHQLAVGLSLLVAAIAVDDTRWKAPGRHLERLEQIAADLDGAIMHKILKKVAAQPSGSPALFHVDANASGFWSSRTPCWSVSLQVPALTGLAMLHGLPPESSGCVLTPYYGYDAYDDTARSIADTGPAEACAAASVHGYSRVLMFNTANELKSVAC